MAAIDEPSDSEAGARYVQLTFPWDISKMRVSPVSQPVYPNPFSLTSEETSNEGGGFLYEDCPPIFLGRRGHGPLRVAWDTNILIDYAEFGELIWRDEEFDPPISEVTYRDELVALAEIMHLWMIRDIRIRMPESQLFDSRRRLNPNTRSLRLRQLIDFHSALSCVSLDVDIDNKVPPLAALEDSSSNDDWDLALVEHAIATGCHVFLTRDQRLKTRVPQSSETFVAVLSPVDLLLYLTESEELSLAQIGKHVAPDTHKWVHVMGAHKSHGS